MHSRAKPVLVFYALSSLASMLDVTIVKSLGYAKGCIRIKIRR